MSVLKKKFLAPLLPAPKKRIAAVPLPSQLVKWLKIDVDLPVKRPRRPLRLLVLKCLLLPKGKPDLQLPSQHQPSLL
jgi:hypothetical protein